jgi:hypothetical protein
MASRIRILKKLDIIIQISGFANHGKRSLDQISVDRNCVVSLDQNYVNHLIEFHFI